MKNSKVLMSSTLLALGSALFILGSSTAEAGVRNQATARAGDCNHARAAVNRKADSQCQKDRYGSGTTIIFHGSFTCKSISSRVKEGKVRYACYSQ